MAVVLGESVPLPYLHTRQGAGQPRVFHDTRKVRAPRNKGGG